MSTAHTILDHQIDNLLLEARGLVLVRELLARRGASAPELDAHTSRLESVRVELIRAVSA